MKIERGSLPHQLAVMSGLAIRRLPERPRRPFEKIYDCLAPFLPPEILYDLAITLAKEEQVSIITTGRERPLPPKEELEQQAKSQLAKQARIHLTVWPGRFPNITFTPPLLSWIRDPDLRKLAALSKPHLSYGFPDTLPFPERQLPIPDAPKPPLARDYFSAFRRLPLVSRIPREGLQRGFDQVILDKLYPEKDIAVLYGELYQLYKEVAEDQIPSINKTVKDQLRFLGLAKEHRTDQENEALFINTVEEALLTRIEAKGGETSRLKQFMEFAKTSDKIREWSEKEKKYKGKRRTGESFYCHYLASAWLLWTMVEADLSSPEEVNKAVEDTELMLVHDIQEDLPFATSLNYHSDRSISFQLTIPADNLNIDLAQTNQAGIEIVDPDIQTLTQGVKLTRDQMLILNAVTKEKRDDDGAHWLDKIRAIEDPQEMAEERSRKLVHRASRCKAADRLSNLLTMRAAGGTYIDVIRKLDETIQSGGQLLWLAHLSQLPPMQALNRLAMLNQKNRFETFLAAVPLIAQVEKRLLLVEFGQEFHRRLLQSKNKSLRGVAEVIKQEITDFDPDFYTQVTDRDQPWARALQPIIKEAIIEEDEQASRPPWLKRLCYLIACHQPPRWVIANIVPAERLWQYLGLHHLVLPDKRGSQPLEFRDIGPYVRNAATFLNAMTEAFGILPGGIDDMFVPDSYSATPNQTLNSFLQLIGTGVEFTLPTG